MQDSLYIDIQNLLVAMAITSPRVVVCLAILPGFGTNTLTGLARHAIGVAIALPAVLPAFYFVHDAQPGMLVGAMLAFKEAGIGLLFGIMLSIPVWVSQSIGSMLDAMRSPIQIQDPTPWTEASAVGGMMLQALVLTMMQAGLFGALTRILIESYALWPAYSVTPPFEPGHLNILIKRFAEFFWHIVVYGAPVVIPLLLIDLAFAIVGVFSSGLQVSFMASPIKALTGLFILMVYWPNFTHYVLGDFTHALEFLPKLMQAGHAS